MEYYRLIDSVSADRFLLTSNILLKTEIRHRLRITKNMHKIFKSKKRTFLVILFFVRVKMGLKFFFLVSNSHKMETALQEVSLCEFCQKKNLKGMKR